MTERDPTVLQKRPPSAASFPKDDDSPSVLVQTRLRHNDAKWLTDEANRAGLSVAGMLRKIVVGARVASRETLDVRAIEARLDDRIDQLKERVSFLEEKS